MAEYFWIGLAFFMGLLSAGRLLNELSRANDRLKRELDEARKLNKDDPEWDGTDAAHPAWWRGNDAGCEGTAMQLERHLDGPTAHCGDYGSETMNRVAGRILALRRVTTELQRQLEIRGRRQ